MNENNTKLFFFNKTDRERGWMRQRHIYLFTQVNHTKSPVEEKNNFFFFRIKKNFSFATKIKCLVVW